MGCEHIAWLQSIGRSEAVFRYEDRLARINAELKNPSDQFPSLTFFMGRRNKDAALRQLFRNNNIRRHRQSNFTNLRVDNATLKCDHPILFADCDPTQREPSWATSQSPPSCHTCTDVSIAWAATARHQISDTLISRLFFLFTDVLCLFAEDLGGLNGVKTLLTAWAALGSASLLPNTVRPRVLIVVPDDGPSVTYSLLEKEDFRFDLLQNDANKLSEAFASVRLIHMPGTHQSPLARHHRLKRELQVEHDQARQARKLCHALFSATHQAALFQRAFHHTARSSHAPFNYIREAWRGNEVTADYCTFLTAFLKMGVKYKVPYDGLASFIASSILMDAYPPAMHSFCARDVFRTFYRTPCLDALRSTYDVSTLIEFQIQSIEDNLVALRTPMLLGCEESSAQVHRYNIQHRTLQWADFRSNLFCLCCLRRKPEHPMPCGHSFCDTCARTFGEHMTGFEYRFMLRECVICQSLGSLIIKLKPPTSGVRILSIDGGGSRGIIPLDNLSLLQDLAGPDIAIHELFDLSFGTSSGGLIVLSVFLRNWDIAESTRVFKKLTRKFFGRQRRPDQTWVANFQSWFNAGCRTEYMMLFDYVPMRPSGPKVAVTATNITDASPFVFSNYNGIEPLQRDCGYRHVRPDDVNDEPFVWQAGRATSAAPVLFGTAHLPSLGTFQDGALKHNNPVNLALWESRRIWPSVSQPDVVVSLGTGTGSEIHSPQASGFRGIFKDGFPLRVYRSFMSSIDGQSAWRELWNRLDIQSRQDYFRLNISLPGPEPALDDIECMEGLSEKVRMQPRGLEERSAVLSALLVSSFFFELNDIPQLENGLLRCSGSIRCRIGSYAAIRTLARLHPGPLEFSKDEQNLGIALAEDDICAMCHCYRRDIIFLVRGRSDHITLSLKMQEQQRKLSGFPASMDWFIEQQQLDSPFGFATHSARLPCSGCDPASAPKKGMKRLRPSSPEYASKRRQVPRAMFSPTKPRTAQVPPS